MLAAVGIGSPQALHAQDLAPRGRTSSLPCTRNAVNVTYSFQDGNVFLNNAVPVTDATAKVNFSLFCLYHSLSFFGRSANITAFLPYEIGNFHGSVPMR